MSRSTPGRIWVPPRTAFRVRPYSANAAVRGVLNRCRCAAGCGLLSLRAGKAEECVDAAQLALCAEMGGTAGEAERERRSTTRPSPGCALGGVK